MFGIPLLRSSLIYTPGIVVGGSAPVGPTSSYWTPLPEESTLWGWFSADMYTTGNKGPSNTTTESIDTLGAWIDRSNKTPDYVKTDTSLINAYYKSHNVLLADVANSVPISVQGPRGNLIWQSSDWGNTPWASVNCTVDATNLIISPTAQHGKRSKPCYWTCFPPQRYYYYIYAKVTSGNTNLWLLHSGSSANYIVGGDQHYTQVTMSSDYAWYSCSFYGAVGRGTVRIGIQDPNAATFTSCSANSHSVILDHWDKPDAGGYIKTVTLYSPGTMTGSVPGIWTIGQSDIGGPTGLATNAFTNSAVVGNLSQPLTIYQLFYNGPNGGTSATYLLSANPVWGVLMDQGGAGAKPSLYSNYNPFSRLDWSALLPTSSWVVMTAVMSGSSSQIRVSSSAAVCGSIGVGLVSDRGLQWNRCDGMTSEMLVYTQSAHTAAQQNQIIEYLYNRTKNWAGGLKR